MATDLRPITREFLTYNSKRDPYNSDQRFLTRGSQNVLINDQKKFGARQGYQIFGSAGTSGSTIPGSTEWFNSSGTEIALRSKDTELILEALINSTWQTLMSLTSANLIFDPYWDSTEKIDRLLFCDGTATAYDWSGAYATLSAITATTVTCQGTRTFGAQRFLLGGTRGIRIKDDSGTWHEANYTGGESTTTLTGLDTDLTAFSFTGGNLIVQKVVSRANYVSSTFLVDFLRVVQNQAWVGSRTSNSIYVSKNTGIADFAFSTPRAPGEGAQLTLDGPGRGIGVLRGDVICFAGRGKIYKSTFLQITVGVGLCETLKIEPLKTTSKQSALHQNLIAEVGNGLMWVGYDNVMYELLDATLSYNPDLRAISDPIKPDFDAADFTGGHMRFENNRVYISAPLSQQSFIYEFRLNDDFQKIWFWQPPQTFPVRRFAVIDSSVYIHLSSASETHELFVGNRDAAIADGSGGFAIHCIGKLSRWNGGVRDQLKRISEFFLEGSITPNTLVTTTYDMDLDAGQQNVLTKYIDGQLADNIYSFQQDPSLGNFPFGDITIEGDVESTDPISHFRITHELNENGDIFDYDITFESNDYDQRWEIMCISSDAELSTLIPSGIGV